MDLQMKDKNIFVVSEGGDLPVSLVKALEEKESTLQFFQDKLKAAAAMELKPPDLLIYVPKGAEDLGTFFEWRSNSRRFVKIPILVLVDTLIQEDQALRLGAEGVNVICKDLLAPALMEAKLLNLFSWQKMSVFKEQIGMLRHELINDLSVVDGKMRKLQRTFPVLSGDEAFQTIFERVAKIEETLKRLSSLRK